MLVRLPLSDSCCHMAHTCSPKVTERPPSVAPAHPSPAPPRVILRGWWPFLCGAHITGVCWRGLHCQQSLYSLWPSLTDTSLNLCLPPSLSGACGASAPASFSELVFLKSLPKVILFGFHNYTSSYCCLHSVFPSFWTHPASLRKPSHFLSSLLRFTHLDRSYWCPVKPSQLGEAGPIPCLACWLHPFMSGSCTWFCSEEPSSIHCV